MKTSFRLANLELHAWAGACVGLMLYVVFVAGSFALFVDDVQRWQQPQIRHQSQDDAIELDALVGAFVANKQLDSELTINLPTESTPYYRLFWEEGEDFHRQSYRLDGEPIPGPEAAFTLSLLDSLHMHLFLPWGRYIVGVATVVFLLALVTGLVYHWRNLNRDLFLLRNHQGRQRFWIDVHNLTGVVGLPIFLMFGLTGAIFNLSLIYQVSAGLTVYKGDRDELLKNVGRYEAPLEWEQTRVLPQGLDQLVERAQAEWPDSRVTRIELRNPGDASQQATFWLLAEESLHSRGKVSYRLSDQKELERIPPRENNALAATLNTLVGLHFGDFYDIKLRWIYFALGLAGALMLISGNLIWLQKKAKAQRGSVGFNRLLGASTLAVGLGIWPAIGVLMLSAQWLPWEISDRAMWQQRLFFGCWLIMTLYAFKPGISLLMCARNMALLTALLAGILPLASASQGLQLFESLQLGDWQLAAPDLMAILFSAAFLRLALRLQEHYSHQTQTLETSPAS